jgi:hypothetical protein
VADLIVVDKLADEVFCTGRDVEISQGVLFRGPQQLRFPELAFFGMVIMS